MLPLAPVRVLLLGLLSWAVLGTGVYFAYDLYASTPGVDPLAATDTTLTIDADREDAVDPASLPPTTAVRQRDWWWWTELSVAALCLLISVGGRLPVRLIFDQGSTRVANNEQRELQPDEVRTIERPCGSRLHVKIFSDHKPTTLVLTHGWSLDSSAWKYLLPKLTATYRVVTWDLAGLGQSQGPANNDYSLDKMSDDLQAIIDETCGDRAVVLVGHSIGGMIQQAWCRRHASELGSRVQGIVLVHTTYTNPISTNMLAGIAKPLEPLVALLNATMIPLGPLYWLSNMQSYWNGSLHVAARIESFTGKQTWEQLDRSAWMGAVASPSVVARGNFGMMKFDEQATLPRITVPVLVISGNHDRLTVPQASKHIESLLPDDRPYSDDGGHLGHWEYIDEVTETIVEFAAALSPSSRILASENKF